LLATKIFLPWCIFNSFFFLSFFLRLSKLTSFRQNVVPVRFPKFIGSIEPSKGKPWSQPSFTAFQTLANPPLSTPFFAQPRIRLHPFFFVCLCSFRAWSLPPPLSHPMASSPGHDAEACSCADRCLIPFSSSCQLPVSTNAIALALASRHGAICDSDLHFFFGVEGPGTNSQWPMASYKRKLLVGGAPPMVTGQFFSMSLSIVSVVA
jgi:hypothetical protein